MTLLASDLPARQLARDEIRKLIDSFETGQQRDLDAILRILADARARLVAQLAQGSEFDVSRAQGMIASIDREVQRLRYELAPVVSRSFRDSMALGDADALTKAQAVLPDGLHLSTGVSTQLVQVANQRSASLVAQISEVARAQLNSLMLRSATGTSRPADVARAIGDVIGPEDRPVGVFGTLATQIERIHRTETSSLYAVADEVRTKRVAVESPYQMLKQWIAVLDFRTRASHRAMNGVTVPVGDPFILDGVECSGPHDSILPAEDAVFCRCSTGLVRGERKPGR